jgi:hypothetical protein
MTGNRDRISERRTRKRMDLKRKIKKDMGKIKKDFRKKG